MAVSKIEHLSAEERKARGKASREKGGAAGQVARWPIKLLPEI
jgi:hypothetical protein